MNLRRVYALFVRQLFLIRGNPSRLSGMFMWLIIDVVQWGFISRYLSVLGQATFSFVTVILGAIILWEFMSRVQQGIMTAFMEDIWSQNFINYFASPLSIGEYVTSLVVTSIVTSLMGLLIMVLIAGVGFGYSFFTLGLLLIPFILILFVFGTAMGIFTAAMIFRLGPSAEWLGWPIPAVLSLFSGVFYPIATLPGVLHAMAMFIPPAYVFESMRTILATGELTPGLGFNLVIGMGLALVYLYLMYRLFVGVYQRNLQQGNIARFSAME